MSARVTRALRASDDEPAAERDPFDLLAVRENALDQAAAEVQAAFAQVRRTMDAMRAMVYGRKQ